MLSGVEEVIISYTAITQLKEEQKDNMGLKDPDFARRLFVSAGEGARDGDLV